MPARVLTSSRSFATSECRILVVAARPLTFTAVASLLTSIASLPSVALTMTWSAAPSAVAPPRAPARSTFTAPDVGPGQVVDGDEVGAAESVEVDPLDAGRVHGDVALDAEELESVSVRGQLDLIGAACAVEAHRVRTGLALDRVTAVTWVPDERVVPGAQQGQVVAAVAVDRVIPAPANSVSTPLPPAIVSLPSPPSIVVWMVSVNAPLLSSIRTRSLPAPALTAILAIVLRAKLKSAEPSSPTST